MTNLPRRASSEVLDSVSSSRSKWMAAALLAVSVPAFAANQTALPNRVKSAIDNTSRAALAGSVPPRALHSTDLGAVSPASKLQGITITFSRSAAQQSDLEALITAQQTPGSPQYHQWLTPAQFGARFGISDADLIAVQDWLQSQGFTNIAVSPARERISFSGPEAAIETAFGTTLHFFRATSGGMLASSDADDEITHIAPARDITVPAALSGIVLSVGNLSDYRMKPHMVKRPNANFTSATSGNLYLTPKDVATIYDIPSTYTGSGQTIVVAGQSAVLSTDISNFQTALGVTNTPTYTLVPNTGASTLFTGDELESDLDVEYSSTIAQKAAVNFVYTGNSQTYGVFDAAIYAIDYRLANIISISYGSCEASLGLSGFGTLESYMMQATVQGQTVIASSGDSGSTGCFDFTSSGLSVGQRQSLAVSYPASSGYVTALGGTEFPTTALTSTYFTTTSGTDVIGSAKSYIPEVVWNDDAAALAAAQQGATFSPSSGGGGVSQFATRPSWQTGTVGGVAISSINGGNGRLVPDISLDSSPDDAGYLYCTSDTGSGGISFSGSCTNGFRVASGTNAGGLTVAGGTSFAAPIFAGMLAILNQAKGYTSGQGIGVNTNLYALATSSAIYSSSATPPAGTAFHDVVVGTNACTSGATYCGTGSQTTSFAATTGYDEATGLGSIDLGNLIAAWPAYVPGGTSTLSSAMSLSVATNPPALIGVDNITITVTGTGATKPSGSVTVFDNGVARGGATVTNGTGVYPYTPPSSGVHTLVFTYSDPSGIYPSATATTILNVNNVGFTISAAGISLPNAGSATETVTITPTNGYTGTIVLSASTTSVVNGICVTGPLGIKVTTAAAVTASFTVYAGATTCPTNSHTISATTLRAASGTPSRAPWRGLPVPATLAGMALVFGLRRRSRLLRGGMGLTLSLAFVLGLGLCSVGLTGCSNGASGASPTTTTTTSTAVTTPGSYNLTVVGHDSASFPVTASATATITITQ